MGLKEIIAELDAEVGRLKEARSLLAGTKGSGTQKATSFALGANQQAAPHKRRRLSAKARVRISVAQKKRWAAKRKAAKP